MDARLRLFWRQMREHWVIAIIAALVVVIVLIITGYIFNWGWLGVNGFNKVTIATDFSSSPPKITRTEEYQPGKTLWDWFNLLGVLAIPVVVGLGAAWYTAQQGKVSERESTDNQRETALQAYIDKISELILKEHLVELTPEYDEVRKIARVRTLTVLRRLDGDRKGSVINFLQESGLIKHGMEDNPIIHLKDADLRKAQLSDADLSNADLSGSWMVGAGMESAILEGANLSDVRLHDADLSGVDMRKTTLSNVILMGATLLNANFSGNELKDVGMNRADLTYADLTDTDLTHVGLVNSILHGTKLIRANLTRADLRKADLYGADLSEANLSRANLQGAMYNTKQILVKDSTGFPFSWAPTQWPQGFDPVSAGLTCVDC